MEKEELESRANFENTPLEIPPIPTTHEVLEIASDFYNFVENGKIFLIYIILIDEIKTNCIILRIIITNTKLRNKKWLLT